MGFNGKKVEELIMTRITMMYPLQTLGFAKIEFWLLEFFCA